MISIGDGETWPNLLSGFGVSWTTAMFNSVSKREKPSSADLLPLVCEDLRRWVAARMALEAAEHARPPAALVHEAWLQWVGAGQTPPKSCLSAIKVYSGAYYENFVLGKLMRHRFRDRAISDHRNDRVGRVNFPIQAGDVNGAIRILNPRQRFAGEQTETTGDFLRN